MTYVLGIDPGGTTGVCLLKLPNGSPAEVEYLSEISGGTYGVIDWWRANKALFANEAYIVCEAFELDGRTPKPDLTPREIIGALKVLVPWNCLHFQTNTQGKHLMSNEVLKRAGYYPKRGEVKGGHGLDGLRHALTYVVKTLKHKPTLELLFPKEES